MAKKQGFDGWSSGRAEWTRVRFDYADTYERELLRAQKKAGRKIGRAVVKERIANLIAENRERIGGGIRNNVSRSLGRNSIQGKGKISPRRKKAVRSLVGRDGTLVVLDHAPMAMIRETGGIIRAKDKKLKVIDRRRGVKVGKKNTFVKDGLIFEKKPYRKRQRNQAGKPIGPKPKQPEPRLIGALRQEVAIPQLPQKARLSNIAERHLKDYRDLFAQYLIEGTK
ncbi:hypothetical protein [Roseovarius indicus]|uniref:hypothetical protein n=1 Tax=Roseovarius indicus TaxID=540747 RepID=UPI0040589E90